MKESRAGVEVLRIELDVLMRSEVNGTTQRSALLHRLVFSNLSLYFWSQENEVHLARFAFVLRVL